MNKVAILCIVLGASLWGTIGWFVRKLYEFGFSPMEVVTLRATTTTILLLTYLIIISPKTLCLSSFRDIKYFIGTGIFSIIFFNYCMFSTIELSTIPIATALLYTAPAFVTIFSFFLFKEAITQRKTIALVGTLLGTCFVVGLLPFQVNSLPLGSLLFGIGSAIGYAMYSIFSKYALQKYSSLAITTYTFIVATITLLPFFPFRDKLDIFLQPEVLFYAFGLGLFPTAIAYIVYTYGLNKTEASKASIISTVEPVVATLIGIFIFKETLTLIQLIGMLLIIGAVISMQIPSKKIKIELNN
ncbi:DMT family transporter [Ornithinibacillus scapharcae]|uniref:DMT family transporter n=1 Tax=Ornithinibacillus scapharcae TaxID=1147159 RepID=UPI000225AB17|nr:EamA family transporter [Ornithinibacillus scapharcae]